MEVPTGPRWRPTTATSLAVDLPAASPNLTTLLDQLDALVTDAGGRVYLAKDARLDPAQVRAMYPQLPRWQAVRNRADPRGALVSDLARHVQGEVLNVNGGSVLAG